MQTKNETYCYLTVNLTVIHCYCTVFSLLFCNIHFIPNI